jgi:hypothetical protein
MRNEFQEEDLERYGVWVKAGPEEVVEADEDFSFADLPSDASSSESDSGALEFSDTPALDDGDDLDFPDFDDIDLADDDEPTVPAMDLESSDEELAIATPSSDASGDDSLELTDETDEDLVSLDDLDLEVPDEETDPFAVLGSDEDESPQSEEGTEEFDLEELADTLDDDFEALEVESPEILAESGDDAFDSTIPGSDDELDDISLDDIGYEEEEDAEELPELDSETDDEHDFTPEEQGIEIVDDGATNQITPEEEAFLAEEEDLQNADESAIQKQMDTQEREAFERIQTELHDIKRELAELKEALRGSRVGDTPVPQATAAAEPDLDETVFAEPEAAEEPHGSGFFEEDEDETIALTGDELDNILNTAEFTELAGQEEELDDDFLVDSVPAGRDEEDFGGTDVSEIEMEPVEDEFSEDESDDPAVSELAEMDIDQELADIEGLSDETTEDEDAIEIDLDSLDEIEDTELDTGIDLTTPDDEDENVPGDEDGLPAETDGEMPVLDDSVDDLAIDIDVSVPTEEEPLQTEPEGVEADEEPFEDKTFDDEIEEIAIEDESTDDEDFDSFAEAVENDIAGSTNALDETDEIDEIELSDDFDDEEVVEEPDTASTFDDEEDEIELDLDDLDVEDVDLDEEKVAVARPEDDDESLALETPDFDEEPLSFDEEPEEIDVDLDVEHVEEESPLIRSSSIADLPDDLKEEIRSVLSYMDQLLEALPDDKIEEFAQSEHFDVYKRLFEELGLET